MFSREYWYSTWSLSLYPIRHSPQPSHFAKLCSFENNLLHCLTRRLRWVSTLRNLICLVSQVAPRAIFLSFVHMMEGQRDNSFSRVHALRSVMFFVLDKMALVSPRVCLSDAEINILQGEFFSSKAQIKKNSPFTFFVVPMQPASTNCIKEQWCKFQF